MEISDNTGWIITPKSQPSALNLHPDPHAPLSIPPCQIPKSWQSVALSLEPFLIHLASPHYWTGWYKILWTLPRSRNPQPWPFPFWHLASLIQCPHSVGCSLFIRSNQHWWMNCRSQEDVALVWIFTSCLFNNLGYASFHPGTVGWECKTKGLTDYQEMASQQAWRGWNMESVWKGFWMVVLGGMIETHIITRGKAQQCYNIYCFTGK